jgi:hypothetical protein
MTRKILKIMEEEWDYLIILDACRYDYFAALWKNYFDGVLEKRASLGSWTLEWCLKSFKSYYPDVIYVSGNPYINSKIQIKGFDARRHFYKIIDVWDFGWDEDLGTVPPENINKITLSLVPKFPQKRFIIHYLQPHSPYISRKFQTIGFPKPNPRHGQILTGIRTYPAKKCFGVLANLVGNLPVKANIRKKLWELRELLGLPPATPMDDIRRKYGVNGLREAYRENLIIVLEHVAKLCDELLYYKPSGRIVITSDHGELLGENGKYGHEIRDLHTLEVPWLIVKSVKRKVFDEGAHLLPSFTKPFKENYRQKLKEKIKKLKNQNKI